MADQINACAHLEQFIKENGLTKFQLLQSILVVSGSQFHRYTKMYNAYCHDCHERDVLYLRVCLYCTYFGCQKHIDAHSEVNTHELVMELHYGQVHCFICSGFIFDVRLDKIAWLNALSGDSITKRKLVDFLGPSVGKGETDSGKTVIDRNSLVGLRGLYNLGSTCYMNSVLQALTHTPLLRDYFHTDEHKCRAQLGRCLITKLVRDFYSGETAPLVLNDMLHLVWVEVRYLAGFKQQDAHEFFMAILELFHKHCAQSAGIPQGVATKIFDCECIFHKAFSSSIQTDVVCQNCSGISTRIDPMWAYSLDLAPSVTDGSLPQSLEDCLRHFTATEVLDQNSKIFCEVCKSDQQTTKQDTIKKLPNVLCFHLKRFQQSKRIKKKVSVRISFPECLNMTPYLSKGSRALPDDKLAVFDFLNNNRYVLYAVVVHLGKTLDAGHYIAYVRHQRSMWFRCDDTVISEVLFEQVLQTEAYLLFYHKYCLE